MSISLPSVYAITDRAAAREEDHARIVRRFLAIGVRCVQVREKSMADRDFLPELEECGRLGREAGALILVDDRADLARIAGIGVHLGDLDLPAASARNLLLPGAVLGVSTHSLEEAREAFASPAADYVAFGPVFESGTKSIRPARGLEMLEQVAAIKTKPLVAIGGIDAARIGSVLDAGADSAAMIAALQAGGRIEERTRDVLDAARRRDRSGRVYLVGFMAAGKTTVGELLARRLGVPFVDLDTEIERTSGKTIRALFESEGEAAFRAREATFLEATASLPDAIIATGGGCYVRDDNRSRISGLGTAVFLDVSLPMLLLRLAGKVDRPLFLSPEQAAALWAERESFYRMGSVSVPLNTESVEEAADRVLAALEARRRAPIRIA